VCQVYEIGEQDGELYIVMELLEGEPLMDRLMRGPLPLDEAVQIGLTTLDALAAMHQRGFIHRDLKPSNLLLLNDGRVTALDFGLALPTETDPSATQAATQGLTQVGLAVGSPGYMSPEQIRAESVDARTDLFAMAALIHESITGTRVFGGSN